MKRIIIIAVLIGLTISQSLRDFRSSRHRGISRVSDLREFFRNPSPVQPINPSGRFVDSTFRNPYVGTLNSAKKQDLKTYLRNLRRRWISSNIRSGEAIPSLYVTRNNKRTYIPAIKRPTYAPSLKDIIPQTKPSLHPTVRGVDFEALRSQSLDPFVSVPLEPLHNGHSLHKQYEDNTHSNNNVKGHDLLPGHIDKAVITTPRPLVFQSGSSQDASYVHGSSITKVNDPIHEVHDLITPDNYPNNINISPPLTLKDPLAAPVYDSNHAPIQEIFPVNKPADVKNQNYVPDLPGASVMDLPVTSVVDPNYVEDLPVSSIQGSAPVVSQLKDSNYVPDISAASVIAPDNFPQLPVAPVKYTNYVPELLVTPVKDTNYVPELPLAPVQDTTYIPDLPVIPVKDISDVLQQPFATVKDSIYVPEVPVIPVKDTIYVPELPVIPVKDTNYVPELPLASVKDTNYVPKLPLVPVKDTNYVPELPVIPVTDTNYVPELPLAPVPDSNYVPDLPLAPIKDSNYVPDLPLAPVKDSNYVPDLPLAPVKDTNYDLNLAVTSIKDPNHVSDLHINQVKDPNYNLDALVSPFDGPHSVDPLFNDPSHIPDQFVTSVKDPNHAPDLLVTPITDPNYDLDLLAMPVSDPHSGLPLSKDPDNFGSPSVFPIKDANYVETLPSTSNTFSNVPSNRHMVANFDTDLHGVQAFRVATPNQIHADMIPPDMLPPSSDFPDKSVVDTHSAEPSGFFVDAPVDGTGSKGVPHQVETSLTRAGRLPDLPVPDETVIPNKDIASLFQELASNLNNLNQFDNPTAFDNPTQLIPAGSSADSLPLVPESHVLPDKTGQNIPDSLTHVNAHVSEAIQSAKQISTGTLQKPLDRSNVGDPTGLSIEEFRARLTSGSDRSPVRRLSATGAFDSRWDNPLVPSNRTGTYVDPKPLAPFDPSIATPATVQRLVEDGSSVQRLVEQAVGQVSSKTLEIARDRHQRRRQQQRRGYPSKYAALRAFEG